MKELVNKRINSIQSLEDRKVFRDILNHVFMDLIDYQDRQIENIKKTVFEELSVNEKRPSIYGTMIRKYEYDESDDFMYPMVHADVETHTLTAEEINRAISENKTFMLGRTFLKCDNKQLSKLYSSGKSFEGKIITNEREHHITVRVKKYESYEDMLGHLYNVFIKNGLEWITPNLPYIHKFAAFLLDEPVDISGEEIIEKVEVDLGDYEAFRVDDVFPVWNIEQTMVQSINFPIPTFDNVLNEHRFDVFDISPYCYIPDFHDDYSGYVKRTPQSVSVIIPESEIREWPMYKIHPVSGKKHYVYPFKIYSNAPSDNFYNGYLNAGSRSVRTKGEMLRVIYSFQASQMFKITDYAVADRKTFKEKPDTYSVNHYILDEIRAASLSEKLLVIYYKYKYDDNYISADIMSFIISELQQYIPDMQCIGIERKEAGK